MDFLKPNVQLYGVPWTTDEFAGMPYRRLGQSGLRVSNIGLGTWKIGYPETNDGSRTDEKTAFAIFDRAIETGVTFWDTANRYNNASGNAERVIGQWFKNNPDQRRNVILATKMFGGMDGISPNHSRLSRSNILDSLYASLKRLQLEYVDVLYFHAFDPETPLEESLFAVDDLIGRDLVRYLALSNFSAEQLALVNEMARKISPRVTPVAVQNRFDILAGEYAQHIGVLDYAVRTGLSHVAYSPLCMGLLTERYLDLSKAGPGDRLYDEGSLASLGQDRNMSRIRALAGLAESWGMRLSELALAYTISLPGMGPAIPSCSSVEQLESNARAGKITLTREQKDSIIQNLKLETISPIS